MRTLAKLDGTVVGVVSWGYAESDDVPTLELMSLYVRADQRRTALAAILLGQAIGSAPARLWVFEENLRAKAFYAKHGFAFDGCRQIDPDTYVWEQQSVRH